ncbi:MAG: hypothetical protein ACK53E_05620, partial [Pseudanabaena sp.]
MIALVLINRRSLLLEDADYDGRSLNNYLSLHRRKPSHVSPITSRKSPTKRTIFDYSLSLLI